MFSAIQVSLWILTLAIPHESWAQPPSASPDRLTTVRHMPLPPACEGHPLGEIGEKQIILTAAKRFNTADRKSGSAEFRRARQVFRSLLESSTNEVVKLYAQYGMALIDVRVLRPVPHLPGLATTIAKLPPASKCELRTLMEQRWAALTVYGVFGYDSDRMLQLTQKEKRRKRLEDLIVNMGYLGDMTYLIGSRVSFLSLNAQFVDVFKPISKHLPAKTRKLVYRQFDRFSRQQSRLFSDMPQNGRTLTD